MSTATEPAQLSCERTVPRRLVHKHAVEQVLLTDARREGDGSFTVAAHLPRSHMLFGDTASGHHDAGLLGEAFRQAAIYVTHRFLEVPEDCHFLMGGTTLELDDLDAGRVAPHPQMLEMRLEARGVRRWRDGGLRDYEARMEGWVEGRRLLVGSGALATLPPRRYATMRGSGGVRSDEVPREARDPDALHAGVGRADPRNRLLGELVATEEGYEAALAPDLDHPVFFDHPQDHLPGSLLVEALRQLAVASSSAACGWDPECLLLTRYEISFDRFAELDAPVDGAAGVSWAEGSATVEATIRQGDRRVAGALVELRPA